MMVSLRIHGSTEEKEVPDGLDTVTDVIHALGLTVPECIVLADGVPIPEIGPVPGGVRLEIIRIVSGG
jgi:sulfur carrier protein ThiS